MNVNINARSKTRKTGFIWACIKGHSNVAKMLIEKSVALGIDLYVQDVGNLTALMWACMRGHASIAKLIMEYSFGTLGIALNMDNGFSDSSMSSACGNGHLGAVNLLMENAATFDINAKDDWGRTAFYLACEQGHVNVA